MKIGALLVGAAFLISAVGARGGIELDWPAAGRFGAAAESGPRPPEAEDFGLLELANGERFKVRIEKLDPAAGVLVVRHPLFRGPVEIEESALLRFTAKPAREDDAPPPGWMIELQNDDRIRGVDLAADGERLRFQTLYGIPLTLPRTAVKSVSSAVNSLIYDGPRAGEEWFLGDERRFLELPALPLKPNVNASLILPPLPRKMRMDFLLTSSAFPHSFRVLFHLDRPLRPRENPARGYILAFSANEKAQWLRIQAGGEPKAVASANVRMVEYFQQMQRGLRFAIFSDLDRQEMTLFINGQKAGVFRDPVRPEPPGQAIAFQAAQAAAIGEIRISAWSGKVPDNLSAVAGDTDTDGWILKTGDSISGTVLEIRSGQVSLRSSLGDLTIPLSQIETLAFRGRRAPKSRAEGVEIFLLDGSYLRMRLEKIEDGMLHGVHESFGKLRVPWRAVARLHWRRGTPESPE